MSDATPISINPEDAVAGGLLDDVDITVVSSRFTMFDYNGSMPTAIPSIEWEMDIGEDDKVTQNWSLGDAKNFVPDDDGMTLLKVGTRDNLVKGCNGLILLASTVNVGFPAKLLATGRADVFDGAQFHMERIPAPERKGLKQAEKKEGDFEKTVLVASALIAMPGEKAKETVKGAPKGVKAAPKAAAKVETAETPEDSVDVEEVDVTGQATLFIMDQIEKAGKKGLLKKNLPTLAFTEFAKDPNRNAIVKVICEDAFLSDGPWNYKDGVCTLG